MFIPESARIEFEKTIEYMKTRKATKKPVENRRSLEDDYGKRWNGKKCKKCGTKKMLSEHHLKNIDGMRNGETEILCWPCHIKAEKEYIRLGIVKQTPKKPKSLKNKTRKERQPLKYVRYTNNPDLKPSSLNSVIPFYAKKSFKYD